MPNVLVIFHEIPETCKLYLLDVDDKQAEKLASWHEQFVNSADTPDEMAMEINDYFYPNNGHFAFEGQEIKGPIRSATYDLIVQTGIVL